MSARTTPSRVSAAEAQNNYLNRVLDTLEVKNKGGMMFLWFLILSFLVGLVLYFFKPQIVMDTPTQINWWKLVIAALLIGLVLTFFIWLLKSCK